MRYRILALLVLCLLVPVSLVLADGPVPPPEEVVEDSEILMPMEVDVVAEPEEEVVDVVAEPEEEVVDVVAEPEEEVVDVVAEPEEEVVDVVEVVGEDEVDYDEVVEVVEDDGGGLVESTDVEESEGDFGVHARIVGDDEEEVASSPTRWDWRCVTGDEYSDAWDVYADRWGKPFGASVEAEGTFYNAEFGHPLKEGYTLPGVRLYAFGRWRPHIQIALDAGYSVVYMMGREEPFVHAPVVSLTGWLTPHLTVRLGTLPDTRERNLPALLYSPLWCWLEVPEAGAQIAYRGRHVFFETWVDWSNFIWRGEVDNERFLFGAMGEWTPDFAKGFGLQGLGLARHRGGQIDASDLPVQTSWNAGGRLSYSSPRMGPWGVTLLGSVYGLMSHDGREDTPLSRAEGWSVLPRFALTMGDYPWYVFCDISYQYGERFQPLRGEELLASYLSWGDGRVLEERSVLQGSLSYSHMLGHLAQCRLTTEAFYDLNLRRVDWAFELGLRLLWRTS